MTLVDFGDAASFATRFPNAVIDLFKVGPSLMRSCVGSSASFSAPGNFTTRNREKKGSWLSFGTLVERRKLTQKDSKLHVSMSQVSKKKKRIQVNE